MRAIVLENSGSLSIKEVPLPLLLSGHVMIKVEVAPIHRIDVDFIEGKFLHKK